jgi:hypothetical protein
MTRLDDLLETLWNLEDMHRELVHRLERLITQLETSDKQETVSASAPY